MFKQLRRAVWGLDVAELAGPAVDVLDVQYPVLASQPVIEGRTLYRGEDIEVGGRDFMLLEKCERGGEGVLDR